MRACVRACVRVTKSTTSVFVYSPGEGGTPVQIDPNLLLPDEKILYKKGYETHSFNEYVSNLISVQRTVPDFKPYE